MSEETKTYQLIVRQIPAAGSGLDDLLRILQGEYSLDAYTAKQRLVGPGLVMFGKGGFEKTGKIAALLYRHGFSCWQIVPSRPAVKPSRLRSLEIQHEYIQFESQDGPVRLTRGTEVVAVFADLSGGLIDKHVKRILAQNTYRGRNALEPLSKEEMIPAVFQGKPVLDFYLLDGHGQVQSAIRVLPGKFNPSGLGDRATMSSRGNLEAMLELVKEYARPFRLHCDFGLSQLPKCQVQRLEDGPSALESNLKSLHHYGWLLTRLRGEGRPEDISAPVGPQVGGVAAAALIGQPALGAVLGADGLATAVPGLGEVSQEIRDALRDEKKPNAAARDHIKPPVKKDLPPPPERPEVRMTMRKMLTLVGTFAGVGLLVMVMEGDSHLLRVVARYCTRTGAVPGLIAFGFLWYALHFIRLKRKIENTPTSKVRSIAMGLVEVHGKAWRQYALVAPMTQSACVYYRLRKYRREEKNKWRLIKDVNSSHVAFQIDDGTGRVVVDPRGASVKAKTRQTGFPGQSPLTFTTFDSADENEKWVEDIIYEGTALYVLGFARPLRAERRSLRERSVEKLRELKLDRRALHRYDTDGDGQISEDEWQVARSDAEQAALKEHLAEGSGRKRQEEHVVIARPSQRSMPFVIAEVASEAHLIRNYGLISIPLLIIGLSVAGFAIYKFLEFLGV
ncbi:MAG: hypothetical protein DRH08_10635 [Deltaproteobacteria bacterium]|nr:MAG: hypothetical protein DRH08_10635 [Deltaproteobacteria bacterium]